MGAKNTIKRTEKIFFLTFRSAMPVKRLPDYQSAARKVFKLATIHKKCIKKNFLDISYDEKSLNSADSKKYLTAAVRENITTNYHTYCN